MFPRNQNVPQTPLVCLRVPATLRDLSFTQPKKILHSRSCNACDIFHVWQEGRVWVNAYFQMSQSLHKRVLDQTLYLPKNAQNPFWNTSFLWFKKSQTVLLPFATLYYSNLLTFFISYHRFLKIKYKVIIILFRTWINLPKTKKFFTRAGHDARDI